MGGINHKGATSFPSHIDNYIETELQHKAIIGPFQSIPFTKSTPVGVSPLSSRSKKDSDQRRIIVDCSWPIGSSLNDGLSKFQYLGVPIKLQYPTVDTLAKHVFKLFQEGGVRIFCCIRRILKEPSDSWYAAPVQCHYWVTDGEIVIILT